MKSGRVFWGTLFVIIGVLGILIELYQPGFGIPGIVGISCLIIFFAGHLVVNLAGWVFIMIRKPLKVGDRVQIGDVTGDVIDIRIFLAVFIKYYLL